MEPGFRETSPATVRGRLLIQALRSFYEFLDRYDLLVGCDGKPVRDPLRRIEAPKVARRANDWLRADEDERLLTAAETAQERMVVNLLRWTGLRSAEAVSLRVADVDLVRGELQVPESKTATGIRTVPLLPQLQRELRLWLQHLSTTIELTQQTPLLATRHGTAMKAQFVQRIVKRLAARAGVRPSACFGGSAITPHTLRRTFASDLLNRGVRLETVSQLLGHADTRTTQLYYAELLPDVVKREFYAAFATPHAPNDPAPANATTDATTVESVTDAAPRLRLIIGGAT